MQKGFRSVRFVDRKGALLILELAGVLPPPTVPLGFLLSLEPMSRRITSNEPWVETQTNTHTIVTLIFTHKETARLCECYYNKCFSKDLTAERFDYQGHANESISVCLSSVSSCELLRGSILTLSDDSEKFKRHSTVETCLVPVAKYPAKAA